MLVIGPLARLVHVTVTALGISVIQCVVSKRRISNRAVSATAAMREDCSHQRGASIGGPVNIRVPGAVAVGDCPDLMARPLMAAQ